jgi:hypothetical protein
MTSFSKSPETQQHEVNLKNLTNLNTDNTVISYEIIDSSNEYVISYSALLKKNTNGKLDGLKLAKDAVKYRQDYKILEVYDNGYRKLLEI